MKKTLFKADYIVSNGNHGAWQKVEVYADNGVTYIIVNDDPPKKISREGGMACAVAMPFALISAMIAVVATESEKEHFRNIMGEAVKLAIIEVMNSGSADNARIKVAQHFRP